MRTLNKQDTFYIGCLFAFALYPLISGELLINFLLSRGYSDARGSIVHQQLHKHEIMEIIISSLSLPPSLPPSLSLPLSQLCYKYIACIYVTFSAEEKLSFRLSLHIC